MRVLQGLEAAVEVVKDLLKQYDSDSYRYLVLDTKPTMRTALPTGNFPLLRDKIVGKNVLDGSLGFVSINHNFK